MITDDAGAIQVNANGGTLNIVANGYKQSQASYSAPKHAYFKTEQQKVVMTPVTTLDVNGIVKDEKSGERKFDTNEFRVNFEHHTSLHIENIKEYDDNIYVEFESIDFDGELPRNVDDRLERVAELYGFATFDYRWPQKHVYFFWED
jgi:hypothetical protein